MWGRTRRGEEGEQREEGGVMLCGTSPLSSDGPYTDWCPFSRIDSSVSTPEGYAKLLSIPPRSPELGIPRRTAENAALWRFRIASIGARGRGEERAAGREPRMRRGVGGAVQANSHPASARAPAHPPPAPIAYLLLKRRTHPACFNPFLRAVSPCVAHARRSSRSCR
jgi:hypothetical protein